jgi:hypothetical protein
MEEQVHFSVDTRLASLLGETYRSTEAALKELVDNAWDSDADHVWISLPQSFTDDVIVVRDDGAGMTATSVRQEYLAIARDRRSRKGEKSAKYRRAIKDRKGIGKFAGLVAARMMQVMTIASGQRTTISIDKEKILGADEDLEKIPLPMTVEDAPRGDHGTTVTLISLNQNLTFPSEDKLRVMLFFEYGRAQNFSIQVNGTPLSFEDVTGPSHEEENTFQAAGKTMLRFSVTEAKKPPKYPGFVLKVGGKVVGPPTLLGMDEDEEVPRWLLRRLFGEIEIDDLPEGHVTADWSAISENSKPFLEIKQWVRERAREALSSAYKRDFDLRKAHLKQEIDRRLAKLPEHRRAYANEAINRILWKFYRDQPERIAVIADVVLDAMERDEYWLVLEGIHEASHADVSTFATALEQFGLLELALVAERARHRMSFLDSLDGLVGNPGTVEKDMHKALEKSLWVFGSRYALMASNATLKRVVAEYCDKTYVGDRAARRPDLLLSADATDRYLLIEFKRPGHSIERQDEAQAQTYRDELARYLPAKAIDIIVLGGKRASVDTHYDTPALRVVSYSDVISQARGELDWLAKTFGTEAVESSRR